MIATFLSLAAMRIGGLALGYAAIVWLNRSYGPAELGEYLFLLNSVIVIGTLASLGVPTLVQRLSARLGPNQIGAGTRLALQGRWIVMAMVAGLGAVAILALETDQALTLSAALTLGFASLGFALTLVLVETLRITQGPRPSEVQRNLMRPAVILALLVLGLGANWAVYLGVLVATAMMVILTCRALCQTSSDDPSLGEYVAERGRDMTKVFMLGAMGLIFGAMDVVLFGLLTSPAETGIYGAGSRYGMLVNVPLLASNAYMVQALAKVTAQTDEDGTSLAQLRRQIRIMRYSSSILLFLLAGVLPVYAWIVGLPVNSIWPYFSVVAVSFWLQALLGPVNMFMVQAHEVDQLIQYYICGVLVFGLVGGALFLQGTNLAIPVGAAVGANTVKLLSWWRIYRSRGIKI